MRKNPLSIPDGQHWQQRTVTAGPYSVFCRYHKGQGPAVIFLHGMIVSGRYFLPLASQFRKLDWRVYVPDQPGTGGSREPRKVLTTQDRAETLLRFMDAEGIGNGLLVANSYGAQVASELAVSHPTRVKGLVLIGACGDPTMRGESVPYLSRWVASAIKTPLWDIRAKAQDVLECSPRQSYGEFREMLSYPLEKTLAQVRVPVLLLRGRWDFLSSRSWNLQMARLSNGSAFEMAGVAHEPHANNPSLVAKVILDWLPTKSVGVPSNAET